MQAPGDDDDEVAPFLHEEYERPSLNINLNHQPTDNAPSRFNHRHGLKERHIGILAIAGMLGTGLFLTSGTALAQAGPAGALLGYIMMGLVTIAVALTAVEMSAFSPATGGFIAHAQRFVDPALGAATGWNFAYALAIVQAVEIVACTSLVSFWTDAIPQGFLITMFWAAMIAVNMMPVRVFGEVEFVFGMGKIGLVIGLVSLAFCIDVGWSPKGDRLGFKYWTNGDAFRQFSYGSNRVIDGILGRFLAVWSTLVNAAFAYAHVQIIALAGSETEDPRRAIPRALGRTSLGVFGLYNAVVGAIGLVLPATHPGLRGNGANALSSPFAVAAKEAGINWVAGVINAVVLTSAFSAGVTSIFVSSRSLVALANIGHAPVILATTDARGRPLYAVFAASSLGAFAYLSLSRTTNAALMVLVELSSVAGMVSWVVLCFSYLRMQWGLSAQGFSRDDLPYKAPLQPYLAYFALGACVLILVFSGFAVFLPGNWSFGGFLTHYGNAIVFIVLYLTWKRITGAANVAPNQMKLREELDEIRLEGTERAERHSGQYTLVSGNEDNHID